MQMEDLLPARRFVELLQRKSFGLHAGHDRARDLLHRRHEAREVVEGRCRRALRAGTLGTTSVWPSARGITSMKASATPSS